MGQCLCGPNYKEQGGSQPPSPPTVIPQVIIPCVFPVFKMISCILFHFISMISSNKRLNIYFYKCWQTMSHSAQRFCSQTPIFVFHPLLWFRVDAPLPGQPPPTTCWVPPPPVRGVNLGSLGVAGGDNTGTQGDSGSAGGWQGPWKQEGSRAWSLLPGPFSGRATAHLPRTPGSCIYTAGLREGRAPG